MNWPQVGVEAPLQIRTGRVSLTPSHLSQVRPPEEEVDMDDLNKKCEEMLGWVSGIFRDHYPDLQVFTSEYSSWITIRQGIVYVTFNSLCRVDGSEFYLTVDDKSQRRVYASSDQALPVGFEQGHEDLFLRNLRIALKEAYAHLKTKRDDMNRNLRQIDKSLGDYDILRKDRNYYTRFMRKYRQMWDLDKGELS